MHPAASVLVTGCIEGEGTPKGFCVSLGFQPTGEYEEGETIMKLKLAGD